MVLRVLLSIGVAGFTGAAFAAGEYGIAVFLAVCCGIMAGLTLAKLSR